MAEAAGVTEATEIYVWTESDESDPEEAALLQEVLEYADRVKDEEQTNDDLFIPYIGNPDGE